MNLRLALAALVLGLAAVATGAVAQRGPAPEHPAGEIRLAQLPKEAVATLELVRKGGPYPYATDGSVFGNREGRLPKQKHGYYREYTVRTPKVRTRGARRIVKGAAGEFFYTDDHYNSFKRIRE